MTETLENVAAEEDVDQQQLAERLLAQAKEQGVDLVGPHGLLHQLTKKVLETALGRRWLTISATTSTIRSAGTAVTRAMESGPRRC